MKHSVSLTVYFKRKVVSLTTGCISFHFEKERYTPYTVLRAKWYCSENIEFEEINGIDFKIDGVTRHYGFPTSCGVERSGGRTILSIESRGFSAALANNQCADGLMTEVNLESLMAAGETFPGVEYQKDTPEVNYVNYYGGTSSWEAIVCYAIRASGYYPYIAGSNTVRIEPPEDYGDFIIESKDLISFGHVSDHTRIISRITESDIDGTPGTFVAENFAAAQMNIVRCKEIPFDRQWIMDSETGLSYRIDYSMRGKDADIFSYFGCSELELTDFFTVTDTGFSGEVSRLIIEGSPQSGIITTVWCYHDNYCY